MAAPRALRLAALALLLLAPLLPVQAQGATTFYVNVVRASDISCSPDSLTRPDLRVTVSVDGKVVHETVKAQDEREPLYADLVAVRASLPARVSVKVEEAEPGGLFLLGTNWEECDAAPGAARAYEVDYQGEAQREVVARGDDERAAEAVLVLGTHPPPAPRVIATGVGADRATVAWDADPTGRATAHRVGLAGAEPPTSSHGAAAGSTPWTGLCDNVEYAVRVVRDAAPWHVAGQATFRTQNAPPQAARVLNATRQPDGTVSVEWESPTRHDVERFEVHAGPAETFTPTAATERSGGPVDSATFTPRADDRYVLVRTLDTGGMSAVSASFPIGAPTRERALLERACPPSGTPTTPGADVGGATPGGGTPGGGTPGGATPSGGTPGGGTTTGATKDATGGGAQPLLPTWAILALVAVAGALLGAVVVLATRR